MPYLITTTQPVTTPAQHDALIAAWARGHTVEILDHQDQLLSISGCTRWDEGFGVTINNRATKYRGRARMITRRAFASAASVVQHLTDTLAELGCDESWPLLESERLTNPGMGRIGPLADGTLLEVATVDEFSLGALAGLLPADHAQLWNPETLVARYNSTQRQPGSPITGHRLRDGDKVACPACGWTDQDELYLVADPVKRMLWVYGDEGQPRSQCSQCDEPLDASTVTVREPAGSTL